MSIILSVLLFIWQHAGFFLLAHSEEVLSQVDLPRIHETAPETPVNSIKSPVYRKDLSSLKEIRHGDRNQSLIALTFDDGFEVDESIIMLNTLKEKNVHATFFLKGNWIVQNKELVNRIISDGHELGNHTYDHPHFSKITAATANKEIESQESLLITQNNYSPKPYFRFPYGERTPAMLARVNEHGYTSVLWDVDTLDWMHDSATIEKTAINEAQNGSIILMHLGKATTAQVLPTIIDKLREKGFTLVTVSQLIDADPNVP